MRSLRLLPLAALLVASAARPAASATAPRAEVSARATPDAAPQSASAPRLDARLSVLELYSDDTETTRHLSFSEVRTTVDGRGSVADVPIALALDARARRGWTLVTDDRLDVSRAALELGGAGRRWRLSLGRQVLTEVGGARLDGVSAAVRLGETTWVGPFGGLSPHPVTGDIDPRFVAAGLGYESGRPTQRHAGGFVVRLYESETDRAYFSERLYLRLGERWTLFGLATLDFLAPHGLQEDLPPRFRGGPSDLASIDVTMAQARLRYEDKRWGDVSLAAWHSHTLLPRLWWEDWVATQRNAHGVIVEGIEPVGTRRSSLQATLDLRPSRSLIPYVIGRYDFRHNDGATGYAVRPGIKWLSGAGSYLDLFAEQRRYFDVDNSQVGTSASVALGDALSLEAGAAAIYTRRRGDDASRRLVDVYGSTVLALGRLSRALDGVTLLAQLQAFVEPDVVQQVAIVRLAYRARR